jgi:hypothetical protein
MDEDLFDDLMKAVGNTFDELIEFYSKVVEDLLKICCIRKPTLIERFTNLRQQRAMRLNKNKKRLPTRHK